MEMRDTLSAMGFSQSQIDTAVARFVDVELAIEFLFNQPEERENTPPPSPDPPAYIEGGFRENSRRGWAGIPIAETSSRRGAINETSARADIDRVNELHSGFDERFGIHSSLDGIPDLEEIPLDNSRQSGEPVTFSKPTNTFCGCLLQVFYSIPDIRRRIFSLPESNFRVTSTELARNLQKLFSDMEFGNESSVNPNPVIEGLLLSQVSSRSRDEGPLLFSVALEKISKAIIDTISASQRDFDNNDGIINAITFNELKFSYLFAINMREHVTADINQSIAHDENCDEQNCRIFHLEFCPGVSIYDYLDKVFFPNTVCLGENNYVDQYRTIEGDCPRILAFFAVEGSLPLSNEPVGLEKSIYLDRYFGCNGKETMHINDQIELLLEKKRKIEFKIKNLAVDEIPMIDILQYTCSYLVEESRRDANNDYSDCIKCLESHSDLQLKELKNYREQLKKIDYDIKHAWDNLHSKRYDLHAVIVKGFGSLTDWVYIFDRESNIWWMLHNEHVGIVEEETISAFLHKDSSADVTALFYIDSEDEIMQPSTPEEYRKLLPNYIINRFIEKENRAIRLNQHAMVSVDEEFEMISSNNPSFGSVREFRQLLEQKTCEYLENYDHNEPLPSIRNFGYFLLCLERVDLLQLLLADELHRQHFHIPLNDNLELKYALQREDLIPYSTSQIDEYRKLYNVCVKVLRYLVSGLLCRERKEWESCFAWLEKALWENSQIKLQKASRGPEIYGYFKDICKELTDYAQEKILEGRTVEGMEIGNLVLQSAINVGINPPYDFTSYIQTKWREFEKQYESPTPKLQYFLTNMMYPDVKRSSPETEYLFCVPAENVWTQYIRIKIME